MLRLAKLPVTLLLALTLPSIALTLPGCGPKEEEKKVEAVKELPKASNGSPISAELIEFIGTGAERGLKIRLYNHDESKAAVGMMLLFRYKDASGKPLKVKVGTPFEADTDFTSVSGNKYKVEPKKNATLELDGRMLAVPAEATTVEILASSVSSLAADGVAIEDWWKQENATEWPKG